MITLYVISSLVLVCTTLSSLRSSQWWSKMWDTGRLQLAVLIFILLGLGCLFFDYNRDLEIALTILLVVALSYHLYIISPFTPIYKKEIGDALNRNFCIRAVTCNVRMSNRETQQLLEVLYEKNPDFILLTEVNEWWVNQLAVLEKTYPFTILHPQENTYGIAFYSKYPLSDAQVKFLVKEDIPSIHTKITIRGKPIRIIGLHPRPPAPWTTPENKDLEIIMAAGLTNDHLLPTIVTGDLNDVCWSKLTESFKYISGLKDPRVGRGILNTYNANIPLFRYPIDHFFVSKHFKVLDIQRLPYVGSDHFPVFLELNLES